MTRKSPSFLNIKSVGTYRYCYDMDVMIFSYEILNIAAQATCYNSVFLILQESLETNSIARY